MRLALVNMLVLWPPLLGSSSVSLRRSAPSQPQSMPEVGDDRWGLAVSESKRENSAFCYFLILNSAESLEICRKIIIVPKKFENFCVASVHALLWFKNLKLEI